MSVALSVDIHAKVETVVCKAIRRSLPVIASEAKQSIERHVGKRALRKKAGLLRGACHRAVLRADPLARNDGGTHLRGLAARFARGFSGSFRPLQSEGAGNAGRPMRPIAARAMVVVERTRVSQVTPAKHPAFPAQWFYGLLRALPGDRAFLSPSSAKTCFRELDASVEASGPHDFAVRIQRCSSKAPLASTASRPAFVTIASRPSVGRDGGGYKTDLGPAASTISEIQKYYFGGRQIRPATGSRRDQSPPSAVQSPNL